MFTIFAFSSVAMGSAAAGTVGTIDGPTNVKKGLGFYIKYNGVQINTHYILVPSSTTEGFANYTFTASGSSGVVGPFKTSAAGTFTVSLYGATATNVASGSSLSDLQISSNTIGSGVVDTSLFSDLISFLLPIMIIVMIVLAFRFRDRLPGMHRNRD